MEKIKSLNLKKILLVALLIVLTIPSVKALVKPGFFPTQDFIHVARIFEMDKSIKEGQFPVRWVPDFRYGEPLFNFYAPLPFYFGSLVHNLGFSFLDTTKILFGVSLVFSAITMFFLARQLFGFLGGLLATTLYIYAPYHAVDIYVRGALSESLALIFFPLIFLTALNLSQKVNPRNIIFLALSLAGLFFTHNIMTVLFFPFFAGWILFLIWNRGNLGLIKYFGMSVLLGVGLAATFLFPAFFEKDLTQSSKMITGYFDFRGHFVELKQFFSSFWGYQASLWGSEDGMSFQVGIIHWIVLAVSTVTSWILYRDKKFFKLSFFLISAFFFSLFMQHNKSTPIWTTFSLLAYTQFPWRFLGISIFFISLMGGLLGIYFKRKFAPIIILLIAATIFVNINYFRPESYYLDSVDDHYVSPKILSMDDRLPKDYLPFWVQDLQREKILLPHTVGGEAIVSDFQMRSTSAQFNVKALTDSDIEVPVTFFPGWQVWANGKSVTPESPNKYGLLRFKVPQGEYAVKVQLTDTPVRKISNLISLISLGGIIIFLLKRRRSKS